MREKIAGAKKVREQYKRGLKIGDPKKNAENLTKTRCEKYSSKNCGSEASREQTIAEKKARRNTCGSNYCGNKNKTAAENGE